MTLFMRDEEKRAEGLAEGRAEILKNMLQKYSKEEILNLGFTEEEYAQATQTK